MQSRLSPNVQFRDFEWHLREKFCDWQMPDFEHQGIKVEDFIYRDNLEKLEDLFYHNVTITFCFDGFLLVNDVKHFWNFWRRNGILIWFSTNFKINMALRN